MATLYIKEYAEIVRPGLSHDDAPIGQEPCITEQTVAIGVGSAQSAAFDAKTKFIRVHTDAVCSIAIGKSPTAAATNARHAANSTEFMGVQPGHKLAVIQNT